MTFVPARKGWLKQYRGKTYAVSCAQLRVPATKEGSYVAANCWWASKLKEINGLAETEAKKVHPRSDAIVEALERHIGKTFESSDEVKETLFSVLESAPLAAGLHEAILGSERYRQLKEGVEALVGSTSVTESQRTVKANVAGWLDVLHANVKTGLLSAGRWDAYRRAIRHFRDWIGQEADVAMITAPKLESFFAFVSTQAADGKWTAATATGIFMTARQFIRRPAELGVISLPGNISSRRFRFGNGATSVETMTDDELKLLLGFATERTKLYLAIMLNCGMYQNDVAELAVSEVDWKVGTITRKRSKTRDRQDAPTVTYKLWPETFRLLKAHRATGAVSNDHGESRAILTTEGQPLVLSRLKDGTYTSYDAIQSAYHRLQLKSGVKKPLKCLRKTAATKMGSHTEYGAYTQHFLAHAPKGMTDRHYVKPDQAKFDESVSWLGKQFGF